MTVRQVICVSALCLVCATSLHAQAAESPDVVRVLHDWQQASAELPRLSIETGLAEFTDRLSAHELQAAAELCGPISARALIQQYEWTLTIDDAGDHVLMGVPRDELGRLFLSLVDVEFRADSPAPRQLRFHSANRQTGPVTIAVPAAQEQGGVLRPLRTSAGAIQLTSLVSAQDDDQQTDAPQPVEILRAWEAATRSIQRADIEFFRYSYDLTVGVEERGAGRMQFDVPGNGAYELRAVEIPKRAVSARTDPHGEPLAIQTARPMVLSWDHRNVVVARSDELTYVKFSIPSYSNAVQPAASFDRVWYSLASPQRALPATVDVHSDHFIPRFEWSVLKRDSQRIILQGWPTTDSDQQEISELQVVLDPKTHLAQATRLISADRHKETIHVLKRFLLNDDVPRQDWRPDLSRYVEQDPAPLAPPADDLSETQGASE